MGARRLRLRVCLSSSSPSWRPATSTSGEAWSTSRGLQPDEDETALVRRGGGISHVVGTINIFEVPT